MTWIEFSEAMQDLQFLVWSALRNNRDSAGASAHPLYFSGVAPCMEDHSDIEYVYDVVCDTSMSALERLALAGDERARDYGENRPIVRYRI